MAKEAPMVRAALYLRVSTDRQTTENQNQALLAVALHRGWEVVATYDDNGVSGSKSREYRKQFDALLKDATRAKFDVVLAWSVDRLGRSLKDLLAFLDELHGVGCDLYLHQQGIDTTTPTGRAMFQMVGVFAEFERTMIQERVKAGIERARKQGKILGRPGVTERKKSLVRELKGSGKTVRSIARETKLGVGTVHRILSAV
jgi:DNA invertase Pin-like site-specific DNA recombinase